MLLPERKYHNVAHDKCKVIRTSGSTKKMSMAEMKSLSKMICFGVSGNRTFDLVELNKASE